MINISVIEAQPFRTYLEYDEANVRQINSIMLLSTLLNLIIDIIPRIWLYSILENQDAASSKCVNELQFLHRYKSKQKMCNALSYNSNFLGLTEEFPFSSCYFDSLSFFHLLFFFVRIILCYTLLHFVRSLSQYVCIYIDTHDTIGYLVFFGRIPFFYFDYVLHLG